MQRTDIGLSNTIIPYPYKNAYPNLCTHLTDNECLHHLGIEQHVLIIYIIYAFKIHSSQQSHGQNDNAFTIMMISWPQRQHFHGEPQLQQQYFYKDDSMATTTPSRNGKTFRMTPCHDNNHATHGHEDSFNNTLQNLS